MTAAVAQHERRPERDWPSSARGRHAPAVAAFAAPHPSGRVAELQRSIGNHAVGRLLQRKLTINQPGDVYEQEADRIADEVTRNSSQPGAPPRISQVAPSPRPLQRTCSCGGTCAHCRKEETTVQRKEASDIAIAETGAEAPPIVHEVLRSAGQPLDKRTRAFMEPRFGRPFDDVRVHADSRAAESARSVHANAYTVAGDVVFGAGRYAPDTPQGQRLLAHELTHVVQQGRASGVVPPMDADREARSVRAEIAPGQAASVRLTTAPALQRDRLDMDGGSDLSDAEGFESQLLGESVSYRAAKTAKAKKKEKPRSRPQERIPTATTASEKAVKALENAKKLKDQNDPAIWFDSWGNDLRDNNLNGRIDDKSEQHIADGAHYGKVFNAKICTNPSDTIDSCPASDQSTIKVLYKVCIDIPIESYKAAGANVSTSRWIPTFFGELQKKPNWTVWKKPAAPSQLLDGDIVAAANAAHQHAGIVDTGLIDFVINLPGPTASRKFHLFNPSGKNDMKSVPRILFESFLSIDWIARLNK